MLLGAFFTILSSLLFGIATVTMRRGVATASALNGLHLTLLPGGAMFRLVALVV